MNNCFLNRNRQRGATQVKWLAILIVAAVALLTAFILFSGDDEPTSRALVGNQLTYEVTRGPLSISVSETGSVMSAEPLIIKNDVEGRSTIIYLIEEGTAVKEGDLLVELDGSRFVDQIAEQKIRVENANASFIRATENLAVAKNQAESDVSKAELAYRFAKEDLVKYIEGEYPKQLKEAESKVTLAEEELKQANVRLEGSERLFEKKYISQTELERDQLSAKRSALDLELAKDALNLLKQFEYARRIAQLESDVEQNRMALERAERKAKSDVVQAEADLRAKTAEYERQQLQLVRQEQNLANTRVVAPQAGRVVYAKGDGWRAESVAEGDEVRQRQELIHLPEISQMIAEIKIYEANLDQVRVGMPARVKIDALQGREFRGEVLSIAGFPDPTRWWQPDLKVYTTQVSIDLDEDILRTGMSCTVEILVDYYDDTVYVPVQSVMRRGGQPTVWVINPEGEVEPKPVEIGLDNNRMVRIKSGLEPGQRITMTPPLNDATIEEMTPDEAAPEQATQANPSTTQAPTQTTRSTSPNAAS